MAAMPSYTSKTEASRTMGINNTASAITAPVSSPETGFLRHKIWWNSKTKTSIVDVVEVYSNKTFTISPIIGSKSQKAAFFRFVDLHVWNGNFYLRKHALSALYLSGFV
jgi:hypothetical protein